jgi:hypothetical protein
MIPGPQTSLETRLDSDPMGEYPLPRISTFADQEALYSLPPCLPRPIECWKCENRWLDEGSR